MEINNSKNNGINNSSSSRDNGEFILGLLFSTFRGSQTPCERDRLIDAYTLLYRTISNAFDKYYEGKYVIIKKALQVLLISKYDLNNKKRFLFNPTLVRNNKNMYCRVYNESKLESANDNIEEHFKKFLLYCTNNSNSEYSFGVTNNITQGKNGVCKNHFKVPYVDAINLLLFFIYQDGRNFNKKTEYLPHFRKNTSCSKFSFDILTKNIFQLFPSCDCDKISERLDRIDSRKELSKTIEDFLFDIIQREKVDNTFKYFKIIRLASCYNHYLSDNYINELCSKYNVVNVSKSDMIKILNKEIFKNKYFIDYCLNCRFLDPIFIFFQYLQNCMYIIKEEKNELDKEDEYEFDVFYFGTQKIEEKNKNTKSFGDIVKKSKVETQKYINSIIDKLSSYEKLSPVEDAEDSTIEVNEGKTASIIETLPYISKLLNNAVFRSYYMEYNQEYIKDYLEGEQNDMSNYIDFLVRRVIENLPGTIF